MALTIITLKAGNRSSILCNIIIGSLVGETADCFDSLQLSSSLEYSFSWHAKCSLSYQHIPQNFMEIAVQNRVDENDIQCSFKACMVKIHPDTVPYNLFQYHPPMFTWPSQWTLSFPFSNQKSVYNYRHSHAGQIPYPFCHCCLIP